MSETGEASGLPAPLNASPEAETEAESAEKFVYKLEVVQSPSRGRTCGFGDADRRALSAPLIARLRVFRQDGPVEVELEADEIDSTFLICAADLWDADHSREMNLVQHPSYHYKPSPVPTPSRLPWHETQSTSDVSTSTGLPMAQQPSERRSSNASAESVGERDQLPPASGENWALSPTSRSRRPSSGNPVGPHCHPPVTSSYLPAPNSSQYQNDLQPSLSLGEVHVTPAGPSPSQSWHQPPSTSQRRTSISATSPTNTTFAFQAPGPSAFPHTIAGERPAMANRQISYNSASSAPRTASSSGRRPWTAFTNRPSTSATSHSTHAAAGSSGMIPDLTDIACVKNLVGALTTNAHRLRAPTDSTDGVWFVFHDLSVRTEGMFSIRLRLASVGSLITGMAQGQMPIMAEVFTPPFEVMSAKKFPGMLDPTPLSQAFARQGLRIPTRRGANRKRRRTEALAPSEALDTETTPVPEDDADTSP